MMSPTAARALTPETMRLASVSPIVAEASRGWTVTFGMLPLDIRSGAAESESAEIPRLALAVA
jgi:hypothetical protein